MSGRHSERFGHKPVDLAFTPFVPEGAASNTTDKPLIILHGLFGSKRNWTSLCKAFQRDMPDRPIYALDLRNHGTSPHATPMTYEAMARDVYHFIESKQLRNVALLGHSMGGKAAMAYALSLGQFNTPPGTLSHLIIADIAPSIGSLSKEFIQYIHQMRKIEELPPGAIKTRSDADKLLAEFEPDISVRQFLLTNLHLPSKSRLAPHDAAHEKAKFIVPLDILANSMEELGSFPYECKDGEVPVIWDGPVLTVKGSKSPYINRHNLPAMRAFFPNMQLEELDAGHWVHAEKPTEFRKLVANFLQN